VKAHKRFSISTFLFFTFVILVLTIFCIGAAYERDEGTISEGFLWNLLADLFYLFGFPIFFLIQENPSANYLVIGLILSAMFYAFVIERTLNYINKVIVDSKFKRRVKNYKNVVLDLLRTKFFDQ